MIRFRVRPATTRAWARSLTTASLVTVMLSLPAPAAPIDLPAGSNAAPIEVAAEEGPTVNPLYLVPYIAADPDRSTLVRLTNLGTTPCLTSIDWKTNSGDVRCTTVKTIDGGQSSDHCSNLTAGFCGTAVCPQPPPFGFRIEGTAIIKTEPQCRNKIAAEAVVFFFDNDQDLNIVSTTDPKIVKLPGPNRGE